MLLQQRQLEKQRGLVEFAQAFVPVIDILDNIIKLSIGDFTLYFWSGVRDVHLYLGENRVCECKEVCLDLRSDTPVLYQGVGYGFFNIYVSAKNQFCAEIRMRCPGRYEQVWFPIEYKAKVEEFFKEMCKAFNWEIKQD